MKPTALALLLSMICYQLLLISGHKENRNNEKKVTSLSKLCIIFEIKDIDCKCELFIVGGKNLCNISFVKNPDNKFQFSDNRKKIESTTPKPFIFKSLEELCHLFGVSTVNCTCDKFKIQGKLDDLCETTNKITSTIVELHYSPIHSQVYAGITTLSALLAIMGNTLMVSIGGRQNCKHNYILLSQLSCVHIIIGLNQLVKTLPLFWTTEWIYGEFMCKYVQSFDSFGLLLTMGYLLLLAIDKYRCIICPLEKHISMKLLLYGNLLVAIVCSVPVAVSTSLNNEIGLCNFSVYDKYSSYSWFLLLVYFLLPIITTLFLIIKLYANLKQQTRLSRFANVSSEKSKLTSENLHSIYHLTALLIAHIMCVGPYRIIKTYLEMNINSFSVDAYNFLAYCAKIPLGFYICVNPLLQLIYTKRNRKYILARRINYVKNQIFSINTENDRKKSESNKELIFQEV